MNKQQQTIPAARPTDERQSEPGEVATPAAEKRPFVEPAVSVPADVLEATALFQAPTVQTSVA